MRCFTAPVSTVPFTNNWPILAVALLLNCPIWTEDQDFFGVGVATWTTANIGLFLES